MAENSNIEWCDHTVNLFWGCTKVTTGCKNCYAEKLSNRFDDGIWGEKAPRKRIKSAFKDLDKYQKKAEAEKKLVKVFCGSMMDVFEDNKPLLNPVDGFEDTDSLRDELFERISLGMYSNLIFLFLTKRPSNIEKILPPSWIVYPPQNVWLGTSVSNQETADIYVDELRNYKLNNLFLSIEPQVGEISTINLKDIQWVIQGGESGSNKRPFDIKWAEIMKKICADQHVPYFFKQIDKIQPVPEHLNIKEYPVFRSGKYVSVINNPLK